MECDVRSTGTASRPTTRRCGTPGPRRATQMEENAAAGTLAPLPAATMVAIREIYERGVRPLVHDYW